jgi:hypothetical protein
VFALAWLARVLAGNGLFIDYGVEYVIFALLTGLLVSNTIGVPAWLKPAVQTEFYIKTGLVILGAGCSSWSAAGGRARHRAGGAGGDGDLVRLLLARAQASRRRRLRRHAVLVGRDLRRVGRDRHLRRDPGRQEEALLRHVARADRGRADDDRDALARKKFQMPDLVAGAWLGGTLDTSASVVAAGALISDAAMKTGVIVKFSQNALIGVAAFILVVWWAYKARASPEARRRNEDRRRHHLGALPEVRPRLPRRLGPVLVLPARRSGERHAQRAHRVPHLVVRARLRVDRLETRFVDLATMEGGRPALAFIAAQLVNVIWTLLLAYLLFGGVLFPLPNIS